MSTISILLPIYYKESISVINNCFNSIFEQTIRPNEIVCALDDPSTSEIEDMIDRLMSKTDIKIIKCYCKRGSGLGAILNNGVQNCTSDYIARMDIDDIAIPERLEKERDYLDAHRNIDVVGSNIAEFESMPDEIIAYRNVPADNIRCKEMLKRRDPINHMTAMYRRKSILKAGNYSSEMISCEDTYLWTAFYAADLNFANIQENLVFVHAGKEMYERRGGKKAYYYVKKAIDYKMKVGLIGAGEAVFQKIVNYGVLVIMSNRMRAYIYEKILRTKI